MDVQAYIESGVIESYVLGMTDTHESAQLEQLMNQYPEIKQAVTAFEASLERSALSNAVAPKTEVKEKLFAQLKNEFAEQSTAKTIPLQSSVWVKYLAAASIILLLASSALNIYFFKQFNNVNDKYVALLSEKNGILADNKTYQTKMLDMYNSMQMMSDQTTNSIGDHIIHITRTKRDTIFLYKFHCNSIYQTDNSNVCDQRIFSV